MKRFDFAFIGSYRPRNEVCVKRMFDRLKLVSALDKRFTV